MYDSFGTCQIEVDGIENNLRLAGQYYDNETGLHYNWLRYYDPNAGRYLRTDPFGEGLNLYVYCFNNPPFWIDPLGLCAIHGILAAGGMIPAFGIIPDLLDSFLYLVEGEYSGAALAGLAAIPLLGQVTRGGQYFYKGGRYLRRWNANLGAGGFIDISIPRGLIRVKEKLGIYPKKLSGGGKLQAFSSLTGRYVSYAKTLPGKIIKYATKYELPRGIVEGVVSGYFGTEPMFPSQTKGYQWGFIIGKTAGTIGGAII